MIPPATPDNKKISGYWFFLPLFLALALRLFRLGDVTLSDAEASWALQALQLLRGSLPEMGPQPLYVNLTAVFFYLFQAGEMTARLFPALMGTVLTLTPLLFRDRLGSKVALILAFFLALDPGLLAVSRQAASNISAVTLLVCVWGFFRQKRFFMAAGCAGLALLSGPAIWIGALSLALAFFLTSRILPEATVLDESIDWVSLRPAFLVAGAVYFAFGSLFLFAPVGVTAGLGSIAALAAGWFQPGEFAAWQLLLVFPVYQPLALALAIRQFIRGWQERDEQVIFLALWLLVSLILAFFFPSRHPVDLVWAILPLLALAARELVHHLVPVQDGGTWETPAVSALVIVLLGFAWINFSAIGVLHLADDQIQLRASVMVGVLALLGVSLLLISIGWSAQTARQGAAWGFLTALTIYCLGMTFSSAGLRTYRSLEMWQVGPQAAETSALTNQLSDISRYKVGVDDRLDVTIINVESAALRWLLRDWDLRGDSAMPSDSQPSLIVSSSSFSGPQLEAGYRGTDLSLRNLSTWAQLSPTQLLSWVIDHKADPIYEPVIIWVRSDLFVDAQSPRP